MTSLSGQEVQVNTWIILNPWVRQQRMYGQSPFPSESLRVPEGHIPGNVPKDIFDRVRATRSGACVDVVTTTRLPDGQPAALVIRRSVLVPFPDRDWMSGGAHGCYQSIEAFALDRAEQESGVRPVIQGLIGVAMTCCPIRFCSTINICLVGFAPHSEVVEKARPDQDHSKWSLLTLEGLDALPSQHKHWYMEEAFRTALTTMPD